MTQALLDRMTDPGQALIVGDEAEVAHKLLDIEQILGGVIRICIQMTVGPLGLGLGREHRLGTIARLGRLAAALR